MFYCTLCAEKGNFKESLFKSMGKCELCEQNAPCNDIPSSQMDKNPKPSSKKITITIEGYGKDTISFEVERLSVNEGYGTRYSSDPKTGVENKVPNGTKILSIISSNDPRIMIQAQDEIAKINLDT